jgi:hypothetical protein
MLFWIQATDCLLFPFTVTSAAACCPLPAASSIREYLISGWILGMRPGGWGHSFTYRGNEPLA